MENKCRACGLESNDMNNFHKSDDGSELYCQKCFDEWYQEWHNENQAELEKLHDILKLCLNNKNSDEDKMLPVVLPLRVFIDKDSDDEEEDEDVVEEVLGDLTCEQLRNCLRAMNKPVSGCKARLIKRIREHERLTAALFEED